MFCLYVCFYVSGWTLFWIHSVSLKSGSSKVIPKLWTSSQFCWLQSTPLLNLPENFGDTVLTGHSCFCSHSSHSVQCAFLATPIFTSCPCLYFPLEDALDVTVAYFFTLIVHKGMWHQGDIKTSKNKWVDHGTMKQSFWKKKNKALTYFLRWETLNILSSRLHQPV